MCFVRPEHRLKRMLRTTSFRLTLIYLCVFAVSALLLGVTVFLAARSALEQQTDARIEAETAFLVGEYKSGGIERLLATGKEIVQPTIVETISFLAWRDEFYHLGSEWATSVQGTQVVATSGDTAVHVMGVALEAFWGGVDAAADRSFSRSRQTPYGVG